MSNYMPKCNTCEHYNSCEVQQRLKQLSQDLWNINREKSGRKDGFDSDGKYVKDIYGEDAPSVIPKTKEGEWIADSDSYDTGCYTCSNCGVYWQFTDDTQGSAYCPDCGSRMRGGKDE